ncbi:acetyl-CoA hydrolase [Ramlibacter terrae]|uniref:Acetyl-CoA hydrolase n=1 Tax=Ramlibacter terrae TaxID=2732511 RepID=A0ABX6P3Q7_9BURK|nr:acetyl-CoA hydrolase [Ramlibacter terrae]
MTELDPADLQLAGIVRAGDRVMWGRACAEPLALTRALMAQRAAIGRFSAFIGISLADTVQPAHADGVDFVSYCGGGLNRALAGRTCSTSSPRITRNCPSCSPGRSTCCCCRWRPPAPTAATACPSPATTVPAIAGARVVIAEVNQQAPATFGPHTLGPEDIDFFVRSDRPPLELARGKAHPDEAAVARNVASLVQDGDTIQHGIGALPDAIVALLADRRELGLHTGVMGDAAAALVRAGVVTNARKSIDTGVTVAGVLMGTGELNALADRNPALQLREVRYIHALRTLAAIDNWSPSIRRSRWTSPAVNTEVADGVYVGAVGGAVDFIRGAGAARNGRPIVALPSRTAGKGIARIVARLNGPAGAARSDAPIIVTEHGIADLRGLSLRQRVERMIAVAHPEDRDALRQAARPLS